jgi:hypothetical protein
MSRKLPCKRKYSSNYGPSFNSTKHENAILKKLDNWKTVTKEGMACCCDNVDLKTTGPVEYRDSLFVFVCDKHLPEWTEHFPEQQRKRSTILNKKDSSSHSSVKPNPPDPKEIESNADQKQVIKEIPIEKKEWFAIVSNYIEKHALTTKIAQPSSTVPQSSIEKEKQDTSLKELNQQSSDYQSKYSITEIRLLVYMENLLPFQVSKLMESLHSSVKKINRSRLLIKDIETYINSNELVFPRKYDFKKLLGGFNKDRFLLCYFALWCRLHSINYEFIVLKRLNSCFISL